MVAKLWKKIGLIILIVACLFNIISKIVRKLPYRDELQSTAKYVYEHKNETKQ